MNDLEGKLQIFEPISVLQMINLTQATGELRLHVEDNSARVYFDHGKVTFAGITSRPIRLGEYLLKRNLVSRRDLEELLQHRRAGKRLGDMLIEQGLLSEAELRQAIEEQIKEVIYEIVRWRDGSFTFVSGSQPKRQDIFIDIPLDHLILEGIRRLDEEKEKIR